LLTISTIFFFGICCVSITSLQRVARGLLRTTTEETSV
jgi:hypothetical protein